LSSRPGLRLTLRTGQIDEAEFANTDVLVAFTVGRAALHHDGEYRVRPRRPGVHSRGTDGSVLGTLLQDCIHILDRLYFHFGQTLDIHALGGLFEIKALPLAGEQINDLLVVNFDVACAE